MIWHDLNLAWIMQLFEDEPGLFHTSERLGHPFNNKKQGQVVEGKNGAGV